MQGQQTNVGPVKSKFPIRMPKPQVVPLEGKTELVERAAKRLKVVERKIEKFKGFSKETLAKHEARKVQYEKTIAKNTA